MNGQFNSFLVSGVITAGKTSDEGVILIIDQKVRGRMPTRFPILITKKIVGNGLGLTVGDEVILKDVVVYQTQSGEFSFRVCDARDQIVKTNKSPQDYNLGVEEAKEKFI